MDFKDSVRILIKEMKKCSDESVPLFKLTEMPEQASNTYQEQIQKIEKIANGVNLDTMVHLMEVLRKRQMAARDAMESIKRYSDNTVYYATYFNSIGDLINELLITKL